MKSPIDSAKGRISGYDERREEIIVRVPYHDWYTLTKREYKECLVRLLDARPLSDKQRKMCYALLGAISDYTGEEREAAKEFLKLEFLSSELEQTGERIFSLSNTPMSLVAAFQRFLVRFIIRHDIPTKRPLLNYVDDIGDYVYHCLIGKKCVVCGRLADLHHVERVGMGRSREEIVQEGMECLPLCRAHHTEAHTMPDGEFFSRYHLDGGIPMDKTLCKIYGLKTKKVEAKSC